MHQSCYVTYMPCTCLPALGEGYFQHRNVITAYKTGAQACQGGESAAMRLGFSGGSYNWGRCCQSRDGAARGPSPQRHSLVESWSTNSIRIWRLWFYGTQILLWQSERCACRGIQSGHHTLLALRMTPAFCSATIGQCDFGTVFNVHLLLL